MYGIDSANSVGTRPTPAALGTQAFFKPAVAGVSNGTTVATDWLNALQGNLLEVYDSVGQAHSKTVFTGLRDAINALCALEVPKIVDPHALVALPVATEGLLGIVELATAAEYLEDSPANTDRVCTPAVLDQSTVTEFGFDYKGYMLYPGGWCWQWGTYAGVGGGGGILHDLPLAFASLNEYTVVGTNSVGADVSKFDLRKFSASQFRTFDDSAGLDFSMMAWGRYL